MVFDIGDKVVYPHHGAGKVLRKEIKDVLGVTCSAKLVEPRTIQRSEGKAKRVIDNRKL